MRGKIDREEFQQPADLPLHLRRRFFPETVKAEIRAVERPSSSTLRGSRDVSGAGMREGLELRELPAKVRHKAVHKPVKGQVQGPEEYAKSVLDANRRIENCVEFALHGKTKYVQPKWVWGKPEKKA